jgi:hypothetical protein
MDTKGSPDTVSGAPLAGPVRHPAPPSGDEKRGRKAATVFKSPNIIFLYLRKKKLLGVLSWRSCWGYGFQGLLGVRLQYR